MNTSHANTPRAILWDFGGVILSSPFDAFRAYERELFLSEGAAALKAHYGAATLEDAFLAATGRELGTEQDEDDEDEREVFR